MTDEKILCTSAACAGLAKCLRQLPGIYKQAHSSAIPDEAPAPNEKEPTPKEEPMPIEEEVPSAFAEMVREQMSQINKNDLTELRSMASPPAKVIQVI
jgi:hypothetical protein